MKLRPLFVLVSIFVFAGVAAAQRTVTNADLARYKEQRVRAEADLRQNYMRLGFPSPEELARREGERDRVRDELAARLRQQNIEEARLLAEYRMAIAQANASRPHTVIIDAGGYSDGTFLQLGGYGWGRGFRFRPARQFLPSGYFAGGQLWPTGTQTPVQPILSGRRR